MNWPLRVLKIEKHDVFSELYLRMHFVDCYELNRHVFLLAQFLYFGGLVLPHKDKLETLRLNVLLRITKRYRPAEGDLC